MPKDAIINGFIYVIRHIVKNSHKLVGIALVAVLTLGTALSLAVNSNSDLTGRVKLTKEESLKLRKEIGLRKENVSRQREVGKEKSVSGERGEEPKYNDYVGSGTPPDSIPVIETHIGPCNDPFGSPTCVVDGQYTTYDLAYDPDEVIYIMRVKNTSSTTPIYMDKVFLEYYVKGIDQTVWSSRTEWEIYDASAPSTVLTKGHVYNAANVNGYVDFDWSYPGNLLNPINKPPVIPPLGTQTYIVKADIVDDSAGPNTFDYVQVRANDSLTFTPVVGGTLADAHNVNSHFIWHTASGLYYNEAYTDLMDMWGGVPNAFAQWRKRMWSAPTIPTPFCGDGIVNSGEQCDDGNTVNGDGCNNSCQYEFCGDGYFDFNGVDNILGSPDDEACDDGNAINGDGCSMVCEVESTSTVILDIQEDPAINSLSPDNHYIYAGSGVGTGRHINYLNLTPTGGDVQLNSIRLYVEGMLYTNGSQPISSSECANLSQLGTILNQKLHAFHLTNNFSTVLSTTSLGLIPLGSNYAPGLGFYGDDICSVDAYVDLPAGSITLPDGIATHIEIQSSSQGMYLFPLEEFDFHVFPSADTSATDPATGSVLTPAQITGPAVIYGQYLNVDETRLRVIEPSSSLTPYQMTAQQGESDVVFGVFILMNLSHSQDVIVNDINIFDFLGVANTTQPDITNIRLYEYDFATSSTIGAPLASGLNMMSGNQVTATGINLFLSRIPGNSVFIAVVGDISPTFTDSAGFDVGWEGGSHNPDTDTLADNNEIHLSLNANGLANPLTASPAWNVPFEFMFNQCDTSIGNPYTGGCTVGPFNRVYNLDMTLGNLVDVLPSTPLAMIQFQPLPPGEPYESIIVPTGSGLGNAVKVADIAIHDMGTPNGSSLQYLRLSNDDNTANYTTRFGTFYLTDSLTGALLDTGVLSDLGASNDGTIVFNSFNVPMVSWGAAYFDVLAEVLPITQATHSGSILNLYLASTNPTEIELEDAMSGNDLLPSEITNYANDGDTFQQLHVTRRTKPTITYNNGAVVTTITGTVNAKEMYRFSISADPVGPLDWHHITLDSVETAGISSGNYRLYIVGQTTPLNSVGVSAVGGEVTIAPDTIQTIPAGTPVDYVLKSDISVITPAVSQAVSNTLTADDDCCIVTNTAPFLTFNDFVWSDRSAPTHTLLSADWTTGYLVEEFDVDTLIINFSGTGPAAYTRTDLLTDLFAIKGQPLMSGPSGCTDTTPAQEAVWATAISLGVISPYGGGFCGPNDVIVRAEGSKVLADYAVNVTGTMALISPPSPTFPDVPLAAWFYTYVESLYNAMGTIYAPASGMFYPGNLLDSVTAVTWITNLP